MALPSLTGLRFFAAFSILFAHATTQLSYHIHGITIWPSWTSLLGMPLFFVLSGFVIHFNYAKLFTSLPLHSSAYEFLAARFARLYPLMFAALIFALWHDDWMLHVWRKFNVVEILSISYLLNIFSWFPFWVDGKLLIQENFGVAWSVSTEWFFYCAYIFLARSISQASLRQTVYLIFSVCIVSYVFQAYGTLRPNSILNYLGIYEPPGTDPINSGYRWLYYVSPYSRIFEFLLGVLTAQAFRKTDASTWPSPATTRACILIAIALVAIALVIVLTAMAGIFPNWAGSTFIPKYLHHLHMNFALAPAIAMLIFYLAVHDARGDSPQMFFSWPVFVFLGEISYSLYLIHPISLRIVPITNGPPNVLFRLTCAIVITIAMAIGTYTLIEVPGRRFLRGVLMKRDKSKENDRSAV